MIVVDSNIVAYLYLPGEYTVAAEALLEKDPSWAAPVLCLRYWAFAIRVSSWFIGTTEIGVVKE